MSNNGRSDEMFMKWITYKYVHIMIGQKPLFYQSIKHRKSMFQCFFATLRLYHNANQDA